MDTFFGSVPVSVIIPCYCCSNTIERALSSVAEQSCLPQEVILVEDGSPDDGATLQQLQNMCKKYAENLSIRVISLIENQGAAVARNRGWLAATQPYIAFLDADDAWHARKLECQYEYMVSHPDVVLSGHGFHIEATAFSEQPDIPRPIKARPINAATLLLSNSLVTPSVMIKANIPFRFRNGQRYVDDHLLWLEIVLSGMLVVRLEAPLAFVYKPMYGASGLSSNMWAMEKAEIGNYWLLYKRRHLALITTFTLAVYSFVKYIRRLLIVRLRR